MRHTIRTVTAIAAAGVMAGAVLMAGPAEAASKAATEAASGAGACPPIAVSNVDPGHGVMKGTYALKAGPYAGSRCKKVGTARKGQVLYLQCWTENLYGTMWVFARVQGTNKYGWMSQDNFKYVVTEFKMC
jgi:hypothetical protein